VNVVAASTRPLAELAAALRHGGPWLPEGTDYWLWRDCFGDTSFIALEGDAPVGGLLACVPPSRPDEVYIDQVAVHPAYRGKGITALLFDAVAAVARQRACRRLWLSTDPANPAARAWPKVGFVSLGVRKDFKGPGKDREIFEKRL